MFSKYTDIFNQEYIDRIKTAIYTLYNNGNLYYENAKYVAGGFGRRDIPETLENINILNEIVSRDFGLKYKFTHSFSRIYFNGAVLNPHVDREGLDLTCTLTIFHNLKKPWPIHLSNNSLDRDYTFNLTEKEIDLKINQDPFFLNSYSSVNIEPNEMLIFNGRESPHWRHTLACSPEQHSVHVFYHWKLIE